MRHQASRRPGKFLQASRDAHLHAFHQGRNRRPRREHQLRAAATKIIGARRRRLRMRDAGHQGVRTAAARPRQADRGIIIADTKFEFGRVRRQASSWADEVLTPDSSRFWPGRRPTSPAKSQPSFDKQPVRNWLNANWDRTGNPPRLPEDIIKKTSEKVHSGLREGHGQDVCSRSRPHLSENTTRRTQGCLNETP